LHLRVTTLRLEPPRAVETTTNCRYLFRRMTSRVRIDRLLVERGLFASRAQAQAAIAAGRVAADEVVMTSPSQAVSRGGVKLAAALDHFRFDPAGRICLDVGASTGGFSEVLLARGARRVYAVDVGHGQLHPNLSARPQLVSMEGTDIRELDPTRLAEPPDFATVDVSFISLKLVLPPVFHLVQKPAQLLALIKPQFEAGRSGGKKGIVRDPLVHAAVCDDIAAFVAALGWQVVGIVPSPILGGDGNHEFFIAAHRV
jgi:23S rRNA (cytidine1920-2'-O)/16S rRNA (cytidine1409-2'-O)-methyltransferase